MHPFCSGALAGTIQRAGIVLVLLDRGLPQVRLSLHVIPDRLNDVGGQGDMGALPSVAGRQALLAAEDNCL